MKLDNILKGIEYKVLKGNTDYIIEDITYDSRTTNSTNCFIALPGIDRDGHDYIKSAILNGCKCFIVSKNVDIKEDVNIILVSDTRKLLPIISSNLFDNPADKLIKIGITGTKGKTSVSYMIKKVLENNGLSVGVIGTNGTFYNDKKIEHKNTTPESYLVQKYMRQMVDDGIKYLIMEVSSQALKVGRVSNIVFDYAIFTNLSMDHVGKREHESFDDYIDSKAKLFKQSKIGILNSDDEKYERMINNATCKIITYGKNNSDYEIKNIEKCIGNTFGMEFTLNDKSYYVGMPGEFSVYNATSVIILSKLLNISDEVINKSLKDIKIEGRAEIININDFKVVIDYAHNNLSIESIIKTMKEFGDKIITIIGCGGGRARDLRVGIGATVGALSNLTIITADNPRNDDLDEINEDIKKGVDSVNGKSIIIPDREEAIKYAINDVKDKDIILILGKGHEKFQEVKGVVTLFDERKIIENIAKENGYDIR